MTDPKQEPKGAEHERDPNRRVTWPEPRDEAWFSAFVDAVGGPSANVTIPIAPEGVRDFVSRYCRFAGAPTPEKMTTEEAERAYAEAKPVPLPPGFVDRLIARLNDWCVTYGKSLCPPGADTFGEGMREAKKQVAHILASKRTGKAQEWSTPKDAGSRPEAPSSEGSASCANPFDADEILNRVRATTWDDEHDRETFAMSRPAALELLTRLSPAKAAWTKEPKEPGQYWCRSIVRPGTAAHVVRLFRYDDEPEEGLFVATQGSELTDPISAYEGCEFLGPIPAPEE